MKNLFIILFACMLLEASCTHKLQFYGNQNSSVIDIFKNASQKNRAKKGGKHVIRVNIYERRKKAVRLYDIETDTSKLKSFIVIDFGNFEGTDYFGEVIVNNNLKYYYESPYFLSDTGVVVKKTQVNTFFTKKTEDLIFNYLKSHRFAELEALANEKGKTLSGSSFYSIGMYEKGMDSVYVKVIPGFIIN